MSPSGNYTFIHATHPGRGPTWTDGELYTHQCDTQEAIDTCLNCPILDGCRPKSKDCPLTGGAGKAMKDFAAREKLEAAVLRAIKAGWSDRRIRDTLHIGYNKLMAAKTMLRERGEIK